MSIEEARERGVSLQLELLEADHLPTQLIAARGVGEGNRVVCGIEVDDDGRRVAYHLYRDHPNEYYLNGRPVDTVRVPAEEVMHIFRIMRPKQLRGEPWFVRVMMRLLQIDKYDDAELARKNFAASLTAFVTSTAPDDQRPIVPTGAEPQSSSPGQQTIELEPGSVIDLAPDESITIADVDDVGGMYPDFMRQQLRAIASGCGLTYEQVTGDMSMVNYSSIRAGSLEFRRLCEQVQYANFIPQFCSRYVREWLRAEALLGTIDARDYLANREQYEDVEWITPGWDWVDPLKDITAHIMAIEAGLTSRQIVVTSRGLDKERVDRDNIEDKEWQQREGVEYGSKKKTDDKATKSRSKTKRLPKSTVAKEIVQ
ncbi:MAG: phage portal protein [Desulfurellales bacterium]|nr:MAG: phage portal protein [Desulfurellales bacterium]